jgi:hypothetical protein
MSLRRLVALAGLFLILGCGIAAAAPGADLAAHRAMYELKLESSRGSNVIAASGNMPYQVQDACDGWAVRQRLQMTITNSDGQEIRMVSDYATWESKDGRRLRFRTRQTTDEAVTSDIEGEAKLDGSAGGTVHYTAPKMAVKTLPAGTLLPMAHTAAILAAAAEGKRFMAVPLFDGTTANGAQDTFITVTAWNGPQPNERWPDLAKLPSAHVHVAFFDRDATTATPDYEVAMRYWKNGVADDLEMDFGDFVMAGKLVQFKLLPHGC